MPTKPVVYLIAQPSVSRHRKMPNMGALYDHGEVVVLVRPGEYPTFKPAECIERIERRLATFDPDRDMLAYVGGDPLSAVLTGVVLSDMAAEHEWTHFTWLRYERAKLADGTRTDEGAHYTPVQVPIYLATEEIHS